MTETKGEYNVPGERPEERTIKALCEDIKTLAEKYGMTYLILPGTGRAIMMGEQSPAGNTVVSVCFAFPEKKQKAQTSEE